MGRFSDNGLKRPSSKESGSKVLVEDAEILGQGDDKEALTRKPINQESGEPVDQKSGEPIDQGSGEPVNQRSGQPINQENGEPIDRKSGQPVNQENIEPIDQKNGQPVNQYSEAQMKPVNVGGFRTPMIVRAHWQSQAKFRGEKVATMLRAFLVEQYGLPEGITEEDLIC